MSLRTNIDNAKVFRSSQQIPQFGCQVEVSKVVGSYLYFNPIRIQSKLGHKCEASIVYQNVNFAELIMDRSSELIDRFFIGQVQLSVLDIRIARVFTDILHSFFALSIIPACYEHSTVLFGES